MDISAKSMTGGPRGVRAPDRRGVAMPTALFALLVVSVLALGMWNIVEINSTSSVNRLDAVRALGLAEAGAAHALGVLRNDLEAIPDTWLLLGYDSVGGTADDGLLTGYGLSASDEIPATGYAIEGGRYYVEFVDDTKETDGDPLEDTNRRILVRCTGVTDAGGSASVDVVIGVMFPAMAINGDLTITGNADISGSCGSLHANGVVDFGGSASIQNDVSASDSVIVGSAVDSLGQPIVPYDNSAELDIPDLDPMSYCGEAEYILRSNGWFVTVGPPADSTDTWSGGPKFGWSLASLAPVVWAKGGGSAVPGTYCIDGNVIVGGNLGPVAMTILATGSVAFGGSPQLTSDHSEGLLIVSGGDVVIGGTPKGTDNYNGLIYAQSQCAVQGNPVLTAQILCNNKLEAPGAIDLISENVISGNAKITFDCDGGFSGPRRVEDWYARVGGD